MARNHESSLNTTEASSESPWDDLAELSKAGFTEQETNANKATAETPSQKQDQIAQAATKVHASYQHETPPTADESLDAAATTISLDHPASPATTPSNRPASPAKPSFAQKIAARYATGERQRVDRLKSKLAADPWSLSYQYDAQAITTEPTPLQKATRLFADKLGIKTKRSEQQREREAMHTALTEYQQEEQAKAQAAAEEEERRKLELERKAAEYQAEQARREQEELLHEMAELHSQSDRHRHESFEKQRAQEIIERDLNSRLLKVDDLDLSALAEEPGIQKRSITFEDTEIPVYDLQGLPFSTLSTAIDYRKDNNPGEIGTETYKTIMADPAVWAERRDQAERASGFGTRKADARGDTISTSYSNSEHNLDSHVHGSLIYGFEKVAANSVISAHNGDGATNNVAGKAETQLGKNDLDIIKTFEGAQGTNYYTEILLRRYSETGQPKLPDYIITEDGKITDTVLKHAKFFRIPIVNIDRAAYREKAHQRGLEIMDSISENDTYPELNQKLAELTSLSEFKNTFRPLEAIGRVYDIPQLDRGSTPLDRKCLEIAKIEQQKRLDFIADTLQTATETINVATEKQLPGPDVFPQFDHFHAEIHDVPNRVRSIANHDSPESFYSNPGNCSFINITFRLKGNSRLVTTRVYDGARIFKANEAYNRSKEKLEPGDSSFYDKLEPLVRSYFTAYRQNQAAANSTK